MSVSFFLKKKFTWNTMRAKDCKEEAKKEKKREKKLVLAKAMEKICSIKKMFEELKL